MWVRRFVAEFAFQRQSLLERTGCVVGEGADFIRKPLHPKRRAKPGPLTPLPSRFRTYSPRGLPMDPNLAFRSSTSRPADRDEESSGGSPAGRDSGGHATSMELVGEVDEPLPSLYMVVKKPLIWNTTPLGSVVKV